MNNTTPEPANSRKKAHVVISIILMAWPVIGVIAAIFLYSISNFLLSSTAPTSDESFSTMSPTQAIINIVLFVVGSASVIIGPISFVIGIAFLLITLSKQQKSAQAVHTTNNQLSLSPTPPPSTRPIAITAIATAIIVCCLVPFIFLLLSFVQGLNCMGQESCSAPNLAFFYFIITSIALLPLIYMLWQHRKRVNEFQQAHPEVAHTTPSPRRLIRPLTSLIFVVMAFIIPFCLDLIFHTTGFSFFVFLTGPLALILVALRHSLPAPGK